jgi:general secretion pathway protein G
VTNMKGKKNTGFTLIELLVVMVLLSMLMVAGFTAYTSSQRRGRDAKRKADLKAIASALEMYANDKGIYPRGKNGKIRVSSCWDAGCDWGSTFSDGAVYMQKLPQDPKSGWNYVYETYGDNSTSTTLDPSGKKYRLWARLESEDDAEISVSIQYCATGLLCNYAVKSPSLTQ